MSGHLTDHSSLASDRKVLALCPPNRPLFPDTLPLRSEQHFLYALKIVRSLAFYETKQKNLATMPFNSNAEVWLQTR